MIVDLEEFIVLFAKILNSFDISIFFKLGVIEREIGKINSQVFLNLFFFSSPVENAFHINIFCHFNPFLQNLLGELSSQFFLFLFLLQSSFFLKTQFHHLLFESLCVLL